MADDIEYEPDKMFKIETVYECWSIVREETEVIQMLMNHTQDVGEYHRLRSHRDLLDAIAKRFVTGVRPMSRRDETRLPMARARKPASVDLNDTELMVICDALGTAAVKYDSYGQSHTIAGDQVAANYQGRAKACRELLVKIRKAMMKG